jgi:hypothetical protein
MKPLRRLFLKLPFATLRAGTDESEQAADQRSRDHGSPQLYRLAVLMLATRGRGTSRVQSVAFFKGVTKRAQRIPPGLERCDVSDPLHCVPARRPQLLPATRQRAIPSSRGLADAAFSGTPALLRELPALFLYAHPSVPTSALTFWGAKSWAPEAAADAPPDATAAQPQSSANLFMLPTSV